MLVSVPIRPPCVIVDERRLLPRFWATAWSFSLLAAGLSKNTFRLKLRHIDAFYQFCDERFGTDAFDSAISERDAQAVSQMLEAFFHELTGRPNYNSTDVQRWDMVRDFVQHLARLRAPSDPAWSALSSFLYGMGRIRLPLAGQVQFIRALPRETLEDLLEVAHPTSARNPFRGEVNRIRNWLAINLMLLTGLRRGEALILSVNSLKREFDAKRGEMRGYLQIEESHEYDPRTTTPSLKTARSFRRVPVSKSLSDLWDLYVQDYRSDSEEHGFLLSSREGKPWAAESLTAMMSRLSGALSPDARDRFFERSGGKETVSAHDLRHTCATARYQQLVGVPNSNSELVMQQMRAFFGWSYASKMPEHYARAAIEEDLAARWDDLFDARVSLLRGAMV